MPAQADAGDGPSTSGEAPHVPVLLNEVLDAFKPLNVKVYVDGTLGAGGHASAMLSAHPELAVLVGIDLDPTAHKLARARLEGVGRSDVTLHLMRGNYSEAERFLLGLPPCSTPSADAAATSDGSSLYGQVDAMLMDLGCSSMQLDTAERGFSFLRDGPIDMRMDPEARLSAEEIINTWSEPELGRIIRDYGEEKMWRQVARRIAAAREEEPIRMTSQLVQAIGYTQIKSGGRKGGGKQIHPATRTFQALRIAVNDELGQLEQALPAAISALAPGGRLAVISFHSLEDRVVKHAFAKAAGKPTPEEEHLTYGPDKYQFLDELEARAVGTLVTRKPVMATDAEAAMNPRSRSAKLRVLERKQP